VSDNSTICKLMQDLTFTIMVIADFDEWRKSNATQCPTAADSKLTGR